MARGYRWLTAADEDEIWERLRGGHAARSCGQADGSGVGVADRDGPGLSGAVWRYPTRAQAAGAGAVELG
jgi:hypothetical protein